MARIPTDRTSLSALAHEIVVRVRRRWRTAAVVRACVLALAAGVAVLTAVVALDRVLQLPPATRAALRLLPVAAAALPLLHALWRLLERVPDARFALLAEERHPPLRGWLTTSLSATADGTIGTIFERRATEVLERARDARFVTLVPRPITRAAGAVLAAGVLALVLVPGGAGELWRRWGSLAAAPPDAALSPERARVRSGTPWDFGALRVTVEPPAYSRRPEHRLDVGENAVLAGSVVRVSGAAPPAGMSVVAAVLNGPALEASIRGEVWSAAWRVTPSHRGIALRATTGDTVVAHRVVPLAVALDREPIVTLELPSEDVVLATARGSLPLRARAADDIGIGDFRLSWILSRGGGESFSFTEGEWPWQRTQLTDGDITGEYDLDLAAAGLEPGDVLHVRAVAVDANDVTGPGMGVSATRLIRIARDDEMAEVTALTGFPIEAEREPILSQRMIILLTERLIERAPGLAHEALLREAASIANEQARLRGRLTDVVYSRTSGEDHEHEEDAAPQMPSRADADTMDVTEWTRRMEAVLEAASRATGTGALDERTHDHDPDPAVSVNRELLDAFDAMYAAERELRQAEPSRALPHEYRALEILQRAREAERVFLRGRQAVAPVDVQTARGTGDLDDARPAARAPHGDTRAERPVAADVTTLAAALRTMPASGAALALAALAERVLADPAHDARAGALLTRASDAARRGLLDDAVSLALQARATLAPATDAGAIAAAPLARSSTAADYFRRLREAGR